MAHGRSVAATILVALVFLSSFATVPAAQAQSGERCFAETGFCISGTIRTFWEQNGGLAVFGLPLGPQQALLGEDGVTRQTQWFERHRLEVHPELSAPYNVLLGRIGVERLAQQGRDWRNLPTLDPNDADAERCAFFRETNQQVCDEFLRAFRSYGLNFANRPGITFEESLALFGLPVSGLLTETIEGRGYQVQWFERARFELHPENNPPYKVLFGRLGAEVRGGSNAGAALLGKTWQLASFGELTARRPPVLEQAAVLSFDGSRLSGTTGCNNFSGPYTATETTLNIGPVITTLIACAGDDVNRQEQALFQAFQGEVGYTITNNTLQITYDQGRQMLVYVVGGRAVLENRPWQLHSFGPMTALVPAVSAPSANLTLDGARLSGTTGCNNFNGTYTASETSLTVGPLAATLAACTSTELTNQERAILQGLQGQVSYSFVGDQLWIFYDGGRQVLVYRNAQAVVTGVLTYRERVALPPQAVIEVKLVDVSRADAPSIVIASQVFEAAGRQVPFDFSLSYNPAQIDPRNSYAVEARITVDGQLRFITTQRYAVITQGNPTSNLELVLQAV